MAPALLALVLALAPAQPKSGTPTRPGLGLTIGGATALVLGIGAASTAVALAVNRNRISNRYAEATSPGPTGFPPARYADYRELERRMVRLDIAAKVLGAIGGVAIVTGVALLIAGAVRARRQRSAAVTRVRIDWGGGTTLRF